MSTSEIRRFAAKKKTGGEKLAAGRPTQMLEG